ncbi:NAD-dependent epimerase/dehydratase family protein [Pelagicoccus sp. SDUM812003]|uniref:NAD-dependent epimerase/dehydratase family protein n=1 Tax=Pelagicoccus sp. SDUM812003 TaxID=3041267 RepID=UPI00280E666F|nr:NAD-dependent epimerase/dehydratase family protein [Pelagicoccus sp. SDUM812003]MDQ8202420.1 NAD-dependent epimerase/dehydratase family protein [Pelagicoccus sp. SDUM812003]
MPDLPEPPVLPARSVLVTGVSGFVGLRLAKRLLAQGCSVRGLCRRSRPDLEALGIEMVYADLSDAAQARSACEGMDTVFHVAAKVGVWGKLADYQKANVEGTQAIINGCRDFEVKKLIYTSTPSVVYNGKDLTGADESLPYGTDIPSPYPTTKVIAEKAVLAAHNQPPGYLKTVALRPHLIWGAGDPNLIPRVLDRARAGRLRIVGDGKNRVDLTHVENVVDAHLLAEIALDRPENNPGGKAYFISNDEPVVLWDWINELLENHELPPLSSRMSLSAARRAGAILEFIWKTFRLKGEPLMTRFVASELAKDHWFDISAAKRDLGYSPRISMSQGMQELLER